MPSDHTGEPECHRGSCICTSYDLRITQRCVVEDLHLAADTRFWDAMSHPIVKGFVAKRQHIPISGKTVGSNRGARTLYHLGVGNDHRGATWHDTTNQVVWLCAYGLHRSGEPNDAFQIFRILLENNRMYPITSDYRRLIVDRQLRFTEMALVHARVLREAAVSHPGVIQEGILGYRVPVRIVLGFSPKITDLTIAFSIVNLSKQDISFIVRCFAPEPDPLIEVSDTIGGTPLLSGEIAFQVIMPA